MIDKVVELLQTEYPQLNWAKYGDKDLPAPPYGIAKGEKAINGRGIRVIIHRNKGETNEMEDDLRAVIQILSNRAFTSRNGNNNQLGNLVDYTDVTPESDDGTLSMAAFFVLPTMSF